MSLGFNLLDLVLEVVDPPDVPLCLRLENLDADHMVAALFPDNLENNILCSLNSLQPHISRMKLSQSCSQEIQVIPIGWPFTERLIAAK